MNNKREAREIRDPSYMDEMQKEFGAILRSLKVGQKVYSISPIDLTVCECTVTAKTKFTIHLDNHIETFKEPTAKFYTSRTEAQKNVAIVRNLQSKLRKILKNKLK